MINNSSTKPASHRIRPWMLVLLIAGIYLVIVYITSSYDSSTFVYTDNDAGRVGYDGQFTYYIAINPITSVSHLDAPAYRLQRILLPALAHTLTLGNPVLIPWVLLLINLAALSTGTFLLEQLIIKENMSPWFALIFGLFPGMLMPVRLGLTETLAYTLVVLAILLERHNKLSCSALTFALAALTKEPVLVFVLGYMLWMVFEKRWSVALKFGLIAWTPYLLWQLVLFSWLGEFGLGSGGAMSTPFELIPYMGLFRIYLDTQSLNAFLLFAAIMIPVAVYPSLWGLYHSLRDIFNKLNHPYVYLLLANAAMITITPFSTFREPLGMVRYLPGLVLAVIVYAVHFRKHGMLRYSLVWLALLALVITGK